MYNEDLFEATYIIANDIIKNIKKYQEESLYTLIPKLAKKYIKFHNDSVDWECVVMLLDQELIQDYGLKSSKKSELKRI